jgi:hypothetical protein
MTLLRALSMPFHLTSLLFVGFVAVLLALLWSVGGALSLIPLFGTFFLLSWLNKYAFAQLEQAALGVSDAPVASVEMLGPFGGVRSWVHPVLAGGVLLLMGVVPQAGRAAIAVAALLLFPSSVGVLAITHRVIDAVNPLALWRVMVGMGCTYLLLVAAVGGVIVSGTVVWGLPVAGVLRYAVLEVLLLCLYSLIGGTIFVRRSELGFEPRVSPECDAEKVELAYAQRRQVMMDEVCGVVRVRDGARAGAVLKQWLVEAGEQNLHLDVPTILDQAMRFPERRGLATVARTLISHLLQVRRLSLALTVMEAVSAVADDFTPESEPEMVALAGYAVQAGRRSLARAMIERWAKYAGNASLSDAARRLREKLV